MSIIQIDNNVKQVIRVCLEIVEMVSFPSKIPQFDKIKMRVFAGIRHPPLDPLKTIPHHLK